MPPPFPLVDGPAPAGSALAALPAPVASWFRASFGPPTPVQRLAWPDLASGQNLLPSAPTGTGKTLAAFAPLLLPPLSPCGGGAGGSVGSVGWVESSRPTGDVSV